MLTQLGSFGPDLRRYVRVTKTSLFFNESVTGVSGLLALTVCPRSYLYSKSGRWGRSSYMGSYIVPQVVFGRLPDGVHGYTDGVKIFVDDRLGAVQLMCTLQHELIHIERGHTTRQLESEEMAVRYETARRLLPSERAGECKGTKLSEVAKGLGVTKRVLMDRAAIATDEEADRAGCWTCQLCPAIAMRARRMVAAQN